MAQSTAATREQAMGILLSLSIVVGAAIVAAIVGFVIWRRYNRDDEMAVTPRTAFTLADLRKLHREGQLSDEEFERARAAIIAQTRAALGTHEEPDEAVGDDNPQATPQDEADKPDADDESNHSR